MTIIPVGYRLTVKSWENDADNYRTCTIDGLPFVLCKFLVAVCKLHSIDSEFGNMYEPGEFEVAEYHKAIQKLLIEYHIPENILDGPEDVIESYLNRLGLVYGGDFYTRVMESFKVEDIPEIIYIRDVTKAFE